MELNTIQIATSISSGFVKMALALTSAVVYFQDNLKKAIHLPTYSNPSMIAKKGVFNMFKKGREQRYFCLENRKQGGRRQDGTKATKARQGKARRAFQLTKDFFFSKGVHAVIRGWMEGRKRKRGLATSNSHRRKT